MNNEVEKFEREEGLLKQRLSQQHDTIENLHAEVQSALRENFELKSKLASRPIERRQSPRRMPAPVDYNSENEDR